MYQFIESISFLNGVFFNLDYHNKRLNQTVFKHFENTCFICLENEIKIPNNLDKNVLYKCRVIYSNHIDQVEFNPYFQKKINSINLVEDNDIEYGYKYLDRSCLNKHLIDNKSDEILIIKNGFITDTSYSNIIFFDKENWCTSNTFLLNGTTRQYLLKNNLIKEIEIKIDGLNNFTKFKLINSMLTFQKSFTYDINIIKHIN